MIVVAIIGLLAAIAIPSFMKSRVNAQASAIANDFRVFSGAFEQYALETGNYPPSDWSQGAYPTGMDEAWLTDSWVGDSPIGGYYVFHDPPGGSPLVLLALNNMDTEMMTRVDEILDDGNLGSGRVQAIQCPDLPSRREPETRWAKRSAYPLRRPYSLRSRRLHDDPCDAEYGPHL